MPSVYYNMLRDLVEKAESDGSAVPATKESVEAQFLAIMAERRRQREAEDPSFRAIPQFYFRKVCFSVASLSYRRRPRFQLTLGWLHPVGLADCRCRCLSLLLSQQATPDDSLKSQIKRAAIRRVLQKQADELLTDQVSGMHDSFPRIPRIPRVHPIYHDS